MRYKHLLPRLLLGFVCVQFGADENPEAFPIQVPKARFGRQGILNPLLGAHGGCGSSGICEHQNTNGIYGGYLGFDHGWKKRKHTGYEHGNGHHQVYGSRFRNLHNGYGLWHGCGHALGWRYGHGLPIFCNDHGLLNNGRNSRYRKGYGDGRAHVPPGHEHYGHRHLGIHYIPVYVPGYYSESGYASDHSSYDHDPGRRRITYGPHGEALVHGHHGPRSIHYY